MPLVIGIPNAQDIRLKVEDDFMLISGVYAIALSPPFKTKKAICLRGQNGSSLNAHPPLKLSGTHAQEYP
jgi:hypothetical protein